jgi:DUF2075 family protein
MLFKQFQKNSVTLRINSVQLLCLQSNENKGIKVLWNKIIVLMNKGEKGLRVHRVRNSF